MKRYDIAVIGAGMAGASIAAQLAPYASVVLLEAEDMPGYHATGRSAAFWHESLGGPQVQPLTRASHALLEQGGFLTLRVALEVADRDGVALIDAMARDFAGIVPLERLDHDGIRAWVPRAGAVLVAGLLERVGGDIDVAGLHAHELAAFRRAGGALLTGWRTDAVTRMGGGDWRLLAGERSVAAGLIVNAGGAWADQVAVMAGARPIGIAPKRRTIVQIRVASDDVPATLPLVIDVAGHYYFRPVGTNRLWLCPHDETPMPPGDVAPDEIDVATAIDRFERVTDWRVAAVERKWAGLRSFAPDRLPVYGFDPHIPGFFWFAGQGGVGIQTAPAAARLGASLALGQPLPPIVAAIDPERFSPARFTAMENPR